MAKNTKLGRGCTEGLLDLFWGLTVQKMKELDW